MPRSVAAIALAALFLFPADASGQIQIKTGTCGGPASSLENRVACFVKVREYSDEDGLLDLLSPTWVGALAADYRVRYARFLAVAGESRAQRLEAYASERFPGESRPDTTIVRLYDDVFTKIERGDAPRDFMRPVFRALFLWSAPSFTIRTTEVELASRTDSSAKLYLTQKLSSPLVDQQANFERRFIFLWKKERGSWYLIYSPG